MTFPPPKLQYKLAIADIQKHRQFRIALWRSCFMVGCILSLGSLSTASVWEIKDSSQVQIRGNRFIKADTVLQAADLSYPQPVWNIEVASLTDKIESIPSVEVASIKRQIIPPQIAVSLQERIPQAIATSNNRMGFLDSQGEWIAQEFYSNINDDFNLPKLIVRNYQPKYRKSWVHLYQLISSYPELKIDRVEWNQSDNLFLQTKIGKVALGTNLSRLEKQFEIMLKLQNLSDRVDRNKIAYIDLSNPKVNLIQKY
ncbi:MAG: FtsQ-type POTRA domain-containing protein [Cyanobacteria bacterium P01_G01_bin.19]